MFGRIFAAFQPVQNILRDARCIRVATMAMLEDYRKENVTYLELRTTPKDYPDMDAGKYIRTIIDVFRESERKFNIQCRLLLSLGTFASPAQCDRVVKLALNDSTGFITGLDVSGPPNQNMSVPTLVNALKVAKENKLKVSAHLCELDGTQDRHGYALAEVLLEQSLVDRIAHGTHLWSHPALVDKVVQKKLPVEVCPTSNYHTSNGKFKSCMDLHFSDFYAIGHPLAVSCDDRGLFRTSLSDEYLKVASDCALDRSEIEVLTQSAFKYAFR